MNQKELGHLQSFMRFISQNEPRQLLCSLSLLIGRKTSVVDDPDKEMIIKVAKTIKDDIAKKKQYFDIFISKEGHTE